MSWQHLTRTLLVIITACWVAITPPGLAWADEDDEEDDDDSSSSSVITTWPPTTVEWPPQLEGTSDEVSSPPVPILIPGGGPLPPTAVEAQPVTPIVPVPTTVAPQVGG